MNGKHGKEQKNCDRVQHRCRNRLRDRQLRSFLSRTDGTWLDICHSDGSTVGTCGDESHPVEEDKLIGIVISPNDKLGGANE